MGVRYISDWAVGYEEGTSEINIREGTKGIANGAFSNIMWKSDEINSPITSITIPDSVSIIGNLAFGGCNRLETIVIPDSVTKIGGGVFYGCSGLKEVILPASTYALNYHSITNWDSEDCFGFFEKCTSLTSITIPDGVTSIGWYAFNGCTNLTNITIPDSVTSIGNYTFNGCTNLTNITIPNSVTSIGYRTFAGCTSLTNITISNPNCEIYDDAGTICNSSDYTSETYSYTGTITGYENSTAQAYAEKYGRTFISLGEAPALAPGDADASGEVDAVDASAILVAAAKAAIGEDTGWTDAQKAAADVNGDNVFDSVDASYILQYAAYVGVNGYISMLEFINK